MKNIVAYIKRQIQHKQFSEYHFSFTKFMSLFPIYPRSFSLQFRKHCFKLKVFVSRRVFLSTLSVRGIKIENDTHEMRWNYMTVSEWMKILFPLSGCETFCSARTCFAFVINDLCEKPNEKWPEILLFYVSIVKRILFWSLTLLTINFHPLKAFETKNVVWSFGENTQEIYFHLSILMSTPHPIR